MENKSTLEITNLNIYQRLIEVMKKVRYIQKEEKMVNGQYRFVSHDAVTECASEAFIECGIYAQPNIISSEISTVLVKKWDKHEKREKELTYFNCVVKVAYTFINIDAPSERVIVDGFGQGMDEQDKAAGKAISYACKYALLKALGIKTGDDPEKDVDFAVANPLKNIADKLDEDEALTILDFLQEALDTCTTLAELEHFKIKNKQSFNKLKRISEDDYNKFINKCLAKKLELENE